MGNGRPANLAITKQCKWSLLLLSKSQVADIIPPASILGWFPTFSASTTTLPISNPTSVATTTTTVAVTPVIQSSRASNLFIPPKLAKKILDLEYVDMAELVPDSWHLQEVEQSKCCHQPRRSYRKGPISDILLWIDCYSSMVAVLASKYPAYVPQLMAYQKTIIKAHKSFTGEGWVTYDTCYRRRAAVTKDLNWGEVDFHLYIREKSILRCRYCSSEHHTSGECSYAPETSLSRHARPAIQYQHSASKPAVCLLFNSRAGNKCRYSSCRYEHMCINCRGTHPASACYRYRPMEKKFRPESPERKK